MTFWPCLRFENVKYLLRSTFKKRFPRFLGLVLRLRTFRSIQRSNWRVSLVCLDASQSNSHRRGLPLFSSLLRLDSFVGGTNIDVYSHLDWHVTLRSNPIVFIVACSVLPSVLRASRDVNKRLHSVLPTKKSSLRREEKAGNP